MTIFVAVEIFLDNSLDVKKYLDQFRADCRRLKMQNYAAPLSATVEAILTSLVLEPQKTQYIRHDCAYLYSSIYTVIENQVAAGKIIHLQMPERYSVVLGKEIRVWLEVGSQPGGLWLSYGLFGHGGCRSDKKMCIDGIKLHESTERRIDGERCHHSSILVST